VPPSLRPVSIKTKPVRLNGNLGLLKTEEDPELPLTLTTRPRHSSIHWIIATRPASVFPHYTHFSDGRLHADKCMLPNMLRLIINNRSQPS
jgi:hypothetical protein